MSPAAVDPNGTAAASGPLTVEAIPAVRANSAPIPKGVAPATNSDFFKSAVSWTRLLMIVSADTNHLCSSTALPSQRPSDSIVCHPLLYSDNVLIGGLDVLSLESKGRKVGVGNWIRDIRG